MAAELQPTTWTDPQGLFSSMDHLFEQVQFAAFAQGFNVRRVRTNREKKAPGGQSNDPHGIFVRIEIWCVRAGHSAATRYRTRGQDVKTGCPFKAVGSLHKARGNRWVLRVVDGRHNHAPDEDLLDDPEYRRWWRGRVGGASEVERLLVTARMVPMPSQHTVLHPPDQLLRPSDQADERSAVVASDALARDGSLPDTPVQNAGTASEDSTRQQGEEHPLQEQHRRLLEQYLQQMLHEQRTRRPRVEDVGEEDDEGDGEVDVHEDDNDVHDGHEAGGGQDGHPRKDAEVINMDD